MNIARLHFYVWNVILDTIQQKTVQYNNEEFLSQSIPEILHSRSITKVSFISLLTMAYFSSSSSYVKSNVDISDMDIIFSMIEAIHQ
jgi:hypothetical protein